MATKTKPAKKRTRTLVPKAKRKRVRKPTRVRLNSVVVSSTGTDQDELPMLPAFTDQTCDELMELERINGDGEYLPNPEEVLASRKNAAGAPTTYNSKIHPALTVVLMAQGTSKEELCLELGTWPAVIKNWARKHPEFALAIKQGEQLCQAWWTREGRLNIHNKDFNHVLWMMNMSNRFNWSRTDKDGQVQGTQGGTVNNINVLFQRMKEDPAMAADASALLQKMAGVTDVESKAVKVKK